MHIPNEPTAIQFGEIFGFLFALFCLCIIAGLVMIHHQNPTRKSGKSSLCQCFQSNDDSEKCNLTPTIRESRATPDRQSKYSDDEFYIIHANQTRSIVKLDQIQNNHFIYVWTYKTVFCSESGPPYIVHGSDFSLSKNVCTLK